ncbi:MAG: hypothetical protein JKY31_03745 [Rhodobacteraceae bacterium]|nr:hypothetical protein [Paracoccaceae bacterium]
MKNNVKVVLTQKWWKDNKAKTLSDKANLGKLLAAFEPAYKLVFVAKGPVQLKRANDLLVLCKALDVAADKNAKACGKFQKETMEILKKAFPAEVKVHRKKIEGVLKDLKAQYSNPKVADMLKDRTMRSAYLQYAAGNYTDESIKFLMVASKKTDAVYQEFIKDGAPQQINIPGKVRIPFDKAFAAGNIATAPWKGAVSEIIRMLQNEEMKKFGTWFLAGNARKI